MPPYRIESSYPSIDLVLSETNMYIRPDLPLPSRKYHPYTRTRLDQTMVTVDYRYTPPPVPTVSFGPDREDTMDIDKRDDASVESDLFALDLDNLESAVNGNTQEKMNELRRLGRRPSLSTLVIDLALLVKEKLKKLKPVGSGASRASKKFQK